MRTSSLAVGLAVMLAGCGGNAGDPVASAAPEDRVDCALAGSDAFTPTCAVERTATTLTLRHADGGFRRLDIARDGTLTAADGAYEALGHRLPDGRTEVAIDRDRYRMPRAPG